MHDRAVDAERLSGSSRFFSAHTHQLLIAWHCVAARGGESSALPSIARNQQIDLLD